MVSSQANNNDCTSFECPITCKNNTYSPCYVNMVFNQTFNYLNETKGIIHQFSIRFY